jgi:hypothetical protein
VRVNKLNENASMLTSYKREIAYVPPPAQRRRCACPLHDSARRTDVAAAPPGSAVPVPSPPLSSQSPQRHVRARVRRASLTAPCPVAVRCRLLQQQLALSSGSRGSPSGSAAQQKLSMLQRLVLYKGNDPAAQERIIAVARGAIYSRPCPPRRPIAPTAADESIEPCSDTCGARLRPPAGREYP